MRSVIVLIACTLLTTTACGSGISGEYTCNPPIFDKLIFKNDGVAFVTMMGMESPANYTVSDDRIALTITNGGSFAFTKKGAVLEMVMLGDKFVCNK